ncbi:MAG: hypothetical protein IAA31_00740 [Candidatus Anaerobiospirillum merdipullorum]|uniref:Uncharacterized protein n=1 Tax=Candidatus Anaerobiospirillum merdipullorum TaxID=2838450 RepID=A0A9E2NRE6_9GAMM|nr:hypothetical protein [Candidatus Anaerobiospirillum merdipullorum]
MEHNATKSALPADLHGQTLALEGDICALAQKLGIKLTQDKALEDKLGTSIDDALPPKLDELMALILAFGYELNATDPADKTTV